MNEQSLEIGRVLARQHHRLRRGLPCQPADHSRFWQPGQSAAGRQARETIYGLIYDINIDDDQLIRRLVMVEEPRPRSDRGSTPQPSPAN